jgi:predicted N-acyltransferase
VAAAVPVYEFTDQPTGFYGWCDALISRGLPSIPPTGLLVGPRQGYQTHFLRSTRTGSGAAAIAGLVDELRRMQCAADRHDPRACVAMYLTTADVLAAREAGISTLPVLLETDAWIEMPPGGWEAWFDSLTSKRRYTVRREERWFNQAGYRVTHRSLADCYEQLASLAAATQQKYGEAGPARDYSAALRRYVEGTGQQARVAVCERDGTGPVGFCMYYICGETIYLRWTGCDYQRLVGAAEHFNVTYYSQMKLASEVGARRIHAGIRATEAKALRGARLTPLWLLDLSANSVLAQQPDRIRRHNAHVRDRLMSDPRTAAALAREAEWRAFA